MSRKGDKAWLQNQLCKILAWEPILADEVVDALGNAGDQEVDQIIKVHMATAAYVSQGPS